MKLHGDGGDPRSSTHELLEQEARALLSRLRMIKPFALQESSVPAAAINLLTLRTIDNFLIRGRESLQVAIIRYLDWLRSPAGQSASPETANRRYAALRLHFNNVVSELDIFSDVITQRGAHEIGVLLAGLDLLAADALRVNVAISPLPGMVCYLDRGHGAAIRRALTQLPTGKFNPVAVIKVPRERMVSSGIASSLVHEVGHQGAALLDLTNSVRSELKSIDTGSDRFAWSYWSRCLNEIIADLWAVARVGITASIGLIGVVTLPRQMVFRFNLEGPHPMPWLRVRLSIAIGRILFPDPQWDRLEREWLSFYPTDDLPDNYRALLAQLVGSMPGLSSLLINHRPETLGGYSIGEALVRDEVAPSRLGFRFTEWQQDSSSMLRASPCELFAVLGQARYHGLITPEDENQILRRALSNWALRAVLNAEPHLGEVVSGINRISTLASSNAVRR